jgi:ketosteroid isomerase-like protein
LLGAHGTGDPGRGRRVGARRGIEVLLSQQHHPTHLDRHMSGEPMTKTEPPARLAIAQAFVLHLGHLDVDQIGKLLSPTVTYRVPGSYGLAGTFHGPDEVTQHLMAMAERTRGTFDAFKWEDWMVGQDYVSILADIRMQIDQRIFSGRVIFLVGFDNHDKISTLGVFYEDMHAIERFFGT